jgi:Flp pilus assembly protein TadD
MRRLPPLSTAFFLLALPLLAEVRPASQAAAPGRVNWETAYRHNNLGVAHMEQHHYGRAAEEFRRAAEIAPQWAVARVNLAIALFSAHENEEAETAFRKAAELDPRLPHAHYGLALLYKVRGERDLAIESFRRVIDVDPQDADARYNLGLLYQWTGQWDESARHLREAMTLDPTNISAVYKLATALLNSGQAEEGQRLMEQFRKMSADPTMGTTRGQQYGEQGRYAEVITEPPSTSAGGQEAPASGSARFTEVAAAAGFSFTHLGPGGKDAEAPAPGSASERSAFWIDARRAGSGVALGDVDADGDLDVCFADAGGAKGPALRLFINAGDMKFSDRTVPAGLRAVGTGMGCYLGDIDNDRDLDLLLSGVEGVRLFLNDGLGTFKAGAAAMPEDRAPAAGAAFADVDHDGDLDIFVARPPAPDAPVVSSGPGGPAADVVIRFNTGAGVGGEVMTRQALGVRGRHGLGGVFSDFDNDRDVDFVLLDALEPPQLFSNLRGGRWQDVAAERGLGEGARAAGAAAGDYDKDGFMDLALAGAAGALLWRNDAGRRFVPADSVPASPQALSPVFLDYDNDGFIDLFVAGGGRGPLQLWRNLGGGRFADASAALPALSRLAGLRGAAAGDLDGDGDADLIVTRNGGAPLVLRNDGGSSRRWLKVRPIGLNSARQGIGVKVEVQAGGLWQKAEVSGGSGYLSQGPPEVLFGLGERPGAEFVRLLWPGGVLQSELEIAAGRSLQVEELDRKGSSCPVLYAWNGRRFEFVADFIGGGGIGFLVAPGRYTRPDPTEYVKISASQLQPRDGALELRVVQQLEEVAYLDRLELVVVDHPGDTDIYPDERFKTAPPYPEFAVLEVRERIFPLRAGHGGLDRTEALREVDRIYAGDFEPLPWPGYARRHHLALHFGPEAAGDGWRLFLNGWVDYGYSWANYAAAQAGHELFPPILERGAPGGAWEKVSENIGYPAGLARTMVAEPAIEWNGAELRLGITTNMRVAWDQAFLARPRALDAARLPRLQAAAAELRFLGYPREYSPDGRLPNLYDYQLAASSFPWKSMRGRFTRYGDVRELLRRTDDRFVILNRGDEIALRFDGRRLPPLPSGWKRDYLLFADGYAKDMDPHGAFPDTVDPLPFHSMSAYPYGPQERYPDDASHRDYLRSWNTRVLWED